MAALATAAVGPFSGGCDPTEGFNLSDDGWWVLCRTWDEGQQAYLPYGADYGDLGMWICMSQHLEEGSHKENRQHACAQVMDEYYPGNAPHDPDLFVGELAMYDVTHDCTLDTPEDPHFENEGWPSVWELYPQQGEYVGDGQSVRCRYSVTYEESDGGIGWTYAYDFGWYQGCMDPNQYNVTQYCELSDCDAGLLPEKKLHHLFGWEWEDGLPEDIKYVLGCDAVNGAIVGALNSCGPTHDPYPAFPQGIEGTLGILFEDPSNEIVVDIPGKILMEQGNCDPTGGCDDLVYTNFATDEIEFPVFDAAGMTNVVTLQGIEVRQTRAEALAPDVTGGGSIIPRLELRLEAREAFINGGPVPVDPINIVLEDVQALDDMTTCERRLLGSFDMLGGTFSVEISAFDSSLCGTGTGGPT
ncbi:hypothetical protein [Paraliomyxa miuraensis]|uniref:hypothetical protein n=1 Tax=Paraliomyxa miuraensis TaxID=376150 RepID=UPI002253C343|nr:hypothetical protein [Paraliomyxa miuraensis]